MLLSMNLRSLHLEQAHTIAANLPVMDIAKLLRDQNLRQIYVVDEKGFPVGIVSATDIISRVVAEGKDVKMVIASDIMSTPLHMIEIDNDIGKAYQEMLSHSTLSLPIVDNGLLVGVLSMTEALKGIVAEKRKQ